MGFLVPILVFLLAFSACEQKSVPKAPQEASAVVAASESRAPWEEEWEKVLKGARSEGKVVVYGPPMAEVRTGFTEAFQKTYPGITLEYTGISGAQSTPKIRTERKAGIYLIDVYIGGTSTILSALREFAIPLKKDLILPEVKDPGKWMEGRLEFSDNSGEINPIFTIRANSNVVYNSELVAPSEITSYRDFINPKWAGKIIMQDPRIVGAGLSVGAYWYLHPDLGPDYLKAFAANKPALIRDLRLQVELVGRGRYNIAIAPDSTNVVKFQEGGMPLKWAKIMKEGTYSTASFGSVILMDKAPHPDAGKIFLNWLLGKEGQTVWSRGSNLASRRLDVPSDHLSEALKPPEPGVTVWPDYTEENIMKREAALGPIGEIFAGF